MNNDIDPFRQHINALLSSYVEAHLTKDHVEYTYNIFNLLSPYFLKQVPLTDPTSFTIPIDPLDNLFKLHSIDRIAPYAELFTKDNEAVKLLKQHLRTRKGTLKTDRVISEDSHPLMELVEPLWPALTRRSLRASRFVHNSSGSETTHGPTSCDTLIKDGRLQTIVTEDVPDPDINLPQTLRILWAFPSAEERRSAVDLIKTVGRCPQPKERNSAFHAFLHEDVPLPGLPLPEEEFTPLFPRSRRMGQKSSLNNSSLPLKSGVGELARLLPEARLNSDDSELRIAGATLEVVDGWHTIKVSSPISVATPTSSQEDARIDQLFLEDSPPTELTIGCMSEKIEEVIIPRSRRIGGSHGRKPHILHEQTLATFLPSHLLGRAPATPPKPAEHILPGSDLDSLIGQPSLDISTVTSKEGVYPDDEWASFNEDIARLCPNEDPADVIMKVKIESDGFMEVPLLPPPTRHPSSALVLPMRLVDLTREIEGYPDRRPLKKNTKGLSALRASLSWVAFTSDTQLPSHEEICGVSALSFPSLVCEDVDKLLRQADPDELSPAGNRLAVLEDDIDLPPITDIDDIPLIAIARKSRQATSPHVESEPARERHGLKRPASDLGSPFHPSPPRSIKRLHKEADSDNLESSRFRSEVPIDNHEATEMKSEEFGLDPSPMFLEAGVPQTREQEYDYAPCVLHFEDSGDSRRFFEPTTSDSLHFSPIDTTLLTTEHPDHHYTDINATARGGGLEQIIRNASTATDLGTTVARRPLADHQTNTAALESHISHLAIFAQLRARTIKDTTVAPAEIEAPISSSPATQASATDNASAAITMDKSTFLVPEDVVLTGQPHMYLASIELVQRQAIVRELRQCGVDLAERNSLGGVDLIIDPYSAVLVDSLFTLPAFGKRLVDRIKENSWRFQHLLVLLEAYPETLSFRPPKLKSDIPDISAYTPPIIKTIKKLRRDVSVAEACGEKNSGCKVKYSFVDQTSSVGRVVRHWGDLAEGRDQTGGDLWQPRDWLDGEVSLDEEDLSKLDGMNRMSAAILLYVASADEILEMLPEERMDRFGYLIGANAVNALNLDLQKRFCAVVDTHVGTDDSLA